MLALSPWPLITNPPSLCPLFQESCPRPPGLYAPDGLPGSLCASELRTHLTRLACLPPTYLPCPPWGGPQFLLRLMTSFFWWGPYPRITKLAAGARDLAVGCSSPTHNPAPSQVVLASLRSRSWTMSRGLCVNGRPGSHVSFIKDTKQHSCTCQSAQGSLTALRTNNTHVPQAKRKEAAR